MTNHRKAQKPESRNTRFIPIPKWNDFHPWPTPQGIRNRIHAAKRGTDPDFLDCIKNVRGRVLVDEAAFLAWIDAQPQPQPPPDAAA
jgi:hypothetical protein